MTIDLYLDIYTKKFQEILYKKISGLKGLEKNKCMCVWRNQLLC